MTEEQEKKLFENIGNLQGVVSDMATKISAMETSQAEMSEFNSVMQSVLPAEGEKTSASAEGEKAPAKQGNEKEELMASISQLIEERLGNLEAGVNGKFEKMEVQQMSNADPDFNKRIRPEAYKISKEAGKKDWKLTDVVELAKGRLALSDLEESKKEMSSLKERMGELEGNVGGEKPFGSFVGKEPPKDMSFDEGFNEAWKEAGMGSQ